jgi:tetratricopeptide (TPR) repeat protein
MPSDPEFDLNQAHRYFSVSCFNHAWDLIDRSKRTQQEDQEMIFLGLAALWHWKQREDCTPTNLSIGYWQVARIYALLKQADNARTYAQQCLEISKMGGVAPFYLGYAYEGLARAEAAAGNRTAMLEYLEEARRLANRVTDPEDRDQLLEDLETVR